MTMREALRCYPRLRCRISLYWLGLVLFAVDLGLGPAHAFICPHDIACNQLITGSTPGNITLLDGSKAYNSGLLKVAPGHISAGWQIQVDVKIPTNPANREIFSVGAGDAGSAQYYPGLSISENGNGLVIRRLVRPLRSLDTRSNATIYYNYSVWNKNLFPVRGVTYRITLFMDETRLKIRVALPDSQATTATYGYNFWGFSHSELRSLLGGEESLLVNKSNGQRIDDLLYSPMISVKFNNYEIGKAFIQALPDGVPVYPDGGFPGGLDKRNFRLSIADTDFFLHTVDDRTLGNPRAEIYGFDNSYFNTYQWYFEKNSGNDRTYKIRLRGTSLYLHTAGNAMSDSTPVEALAYNSDQDKSYNWVVEPAKNAGQVYVRLAANKAEYLHMTRDSTSASTPVEIWKYSGVDPDPTYAWTLQEVMPDKAITSNHERVSPVENPYLFLGVPPEYANDIHIYNRGTSEAYPWYFKQNSDGSYRIINSQNQYLTRGPADKILASPNDAPANSTWFITPIPNTAGYYIRLAQAPNMFLHPVGNSAHEDTPMQLFTYDRSNDIYYQFAIRAPGDYDYPLAEGTYNIRLSQATSRYLHMINNSTADQTLTEIYDYNETYHNTYRWTLEKAEFGTYYIRLNGTYPGEYLHPVGRSTADSTYLQIFEKTDLPIQYLQYFRWTIQSAPTGGYYVRMALDGSKYMHPKSHSTDNSTPVEILTNTNTTYDPIFRWDFDRIQP